MIHLKNVVKTFYTEGIPYTVLKGIDVTIEEGQFVAIVGKSGSGKSTLLNMITGIDQPTSGEVVIAGTSLNRLKKKQFAQWRGRHLGIVFQFFQLIPTLTLIENVMLPMDFCNVFTAKERKIRALALLEEVGMEGHANKFPSAISGGQQQRVAIARALANDPPIILADEPTGSLDSKTAETIFEMFKHLANRGKTIIMVTHDQSLTSRVDRTIILSDGEIVNQFMVHAFPHLDVEYLSQLQAEFQIFRYQPGSAIIKQGEEGDCAYVITSGEVEVFVRNPNGIEVFVNRLTKGQYFGEIALVRGGTRTATVRAAGIEPVEVVKLTRDVFSNLLRNSDLTRQEIDQLIRERLDQLSEIKVPN